MRRFERHLRAQPGAAVPHGFTLLEMVAGLAVVSVITLSLYASLRIAFNARGSAEAAVGLARAAEGAVERVRLDIESAVPPVGRLAGDFFGEGGVNHLGGGSDYLVMHATTGLADIDYEGLTLGDRGAAYSRGPRRVAGGDIQRVEYQLVPDPDGGEGYELVRLVTKNLLAPTGGVVREQLVARGVRGLSFRYFDYDSGWVERWESQSYEDRLPDAVEIELVVRDGGGREHRAVRVVRPGAAGTGSGDVPFRNLFEFGIGGPE